MKRWNIRPPGSNWGEFGEEDEVGRMNLVTDEKRLRAMREVEHGKVFCLSLPLDLPGGSALNPRRKPPQLYATKRDGKENYNFSLSEEDPIATDVICDDFVVLYTQYSSQWDSLAHYGSKFATDDNGHIRKVYYNGWRGGKDILNAPEKIADVSEQFQYKDVKANKIGVDKLATTCVQGRGVLVDLHGYWGSETKLIGFAELMQAMERDSVSPEEGDFLCLYTGFSEFITETEKPDIRKLHHSCPALNGHDPALLKWISDSGVAALISDNYAVEAIGTDVQKHDGPQMPLHEHCLFKLGVHLGELWYLKELSDWLRRHDRTSFLLTAPPLRLPGAVGSPVTPVATV